MSIFKCKMCGGALEISADQKTAVCEYCGTEQTLPRLDDDRRANLYDRANHFRRNNEFDKAMGIYEQILNEDGSDAEAYWSIVLCRYGIEYVEDPVTHKRVPTVNRAQFTSIFDDDNYKSALANADPVQKAIYEAEAAAINEIQKGILAISQQEEPFDVFICYKETDANGRRTQDSVLANDLYHQLTQEGFKVFFSRITLEDKLGTAYEPYIFAALNSAKVMVVLGTKPEYFSAVWVKNEWSRYLALIKGGAKKTLIPAYRDMDPYDLPEEFSHLQAQDMSKLGFMQDLIRGIKKIAGADEPKAAVKETVVVQQTGRADAAPLLKRAFIYLEDGDWKSADEYCERVLDLDPECAEAYVGKLMAELHRRTRSSLRDVGKPFDSSNNYKKALRFGNDDLKTELRDTITYINERNDREEKDSQYSVAQDKMTNAHTAEEYRAAAAAFRAVPGWKNADELAQDCDKQAEIARQDSIYSRATAKMTSALRAEHFQEAAKLFREIPGWKDADALARQCDENAEKAAQAEEIAWKDNFYQCAGSRKAQDRIPELQAAIELYSEIPGWKDADEQKLACEQRIRELEAEEEAERKRIAAEEEAERKRIAAEEAAKKKKKKKITVIVTSVVAICIAVAIVLTMVVIPTQKYNAASALLEAGKYDEARSAFAALNGYRDAEGRIADTYLAEGEALLTAGDRAGAAMAFGKAGSAGWTRSATLWAEITQRETLSCGGPHTVGLRADGTVVAVGRNDDGECNVDSWTDIVAISTAAQQTVGLKSDGTVVAVGRNNHGQCDVDDWTDIVAVSAGMNHTVGLKSDGTVVVVGGNDRGECNVGGWTDIVAVSACGQLTVGLKSDGTVMAVGTNDYGQCKVDGWTDVVAVSAGHIHAKGLKADGTVAYVGDNFRGQCDVEGWTDIVAVSCSSHQTVGLKSDGTVVAVGANDDGQCKLGGWTDIVAVSSGGQRTVGLKSDGTVVAVGKNDAGQCDVSDWTNIKLPNRVR